MLQQNIFEIRIGDCMKRHKIIISFLLVVLSLLLLNGYGRETRNALLIRAIKNNNVREVVAALKSGADPNACDGPSSPLSTLSLWFQRVNRNYPSIFPYPSALLVALGARADVRDEPYLYTPNKAIVLALIEHGANVNCRGRYNFTPLLQAATLNPLDDALIEMLVQHGADINARAINRESILGAAVLEDHLSLANFLLGHGADIRKSELPDMSLLIEATITNDPAMVQMILAHHIDVNFRNASGWTALSFAQACLNDPKRANETTNTIEIINMLKRAGARQ